MGSDRMIDDSRLGRMALDILRVLDIETQELIRVATADELKTYQHQFAAYLAFAAGEPYHDLYRAFGMVVNEITRGANRIPA